jgi:iron complex outermembrane receptor protein
MCVVIAVHAWADPMDPAPPTEAALEEMTVTAEKFAEIPEKIPISMAVVSGEAALRHGLEQLDEVMATVGGVKVLEAENGPAFYIRGIGTGVPASVGDPEINLNIDGVYQSQSEFARAGLYDVNRIEVLRGPQGTLYGRNALAGVINVVTNDPTFGYEAAGSIGFGNYALVTTQSVVNLPVNDRMAIRFAFGTENHAGYLSNGADDLDVQSERLKILIKPVDSVTALFAADFTREGGAGEGEIQVVPPPSGVPTGGAGLGSAIASSNPWTSPDPSGADRETIFWSARGELNSDLRVGSLTAIAAHRDETYSCLSCWRSETDQNNYAKEQQSSTELRLASLPGSRATWLAGIYYLKSNNPTESQQLGPGADSFSNASGNQVNQQGQLRVDAASYAMFAQSTYPILKGLRVTGGMRYTLDDKSETAYVLSDTGGLIGVNTGLFSSAHTWRSLTYTVGLDYDVTDHSMAYAKLSTGYKAGGFYEGAAPDSYGPEHLISYETGIKSRFDDNRLEINADAFLYDYNDYQVNYLGFINPTSAGIFGILTANASGARVYGAEIEAQYNLSAADKLDAAVYPLESKFKTLVIFGPFGGNYTGSTLPFAPRSTAILGYQHRADLAELGGLTARVESRYESGSWVTFNEAAGTHQPEHTVSNAYLTYDSRRGAWSVGFYVKNMENTPVLVNAQAGPAGLKTADIGPPRTFGLQISAKFAH